MTEGAPRPWLWPGLHDTGGDDVGGFVPDTSGDQPGGRARDEEVHELIESQREEAEEIVQQARRTAADIRRNEGAAAVEEVRERLEELLHETVAEQTAAFEQARAQVMAEVRQAAEQRMEQIERNLAGLVAQMTEKVVHRHVEADDSIVLDVVRATLAEAAGAAQMTVRVSPAAEDLVREAQAELLAAADGADELQVVADDGIGPGGCIVETERGRFDARLRTQMELLGEELDRLLGGE